MFARLKTTTSDCEFAGTGVLMKVLIVKTTSLGDVIHTLPAVNDVYEHNSSIQFDWVVEQPFAEIPTWHPAVKNIIPVNIRKWRKNLTDPSTWKSVGDFIKNLRQSQYDYVIDAQGLIKSAMITRLALGKIKIGFDKSCAREPFSSLLYDKTIKVDKNAHAIQRVRQLFSTALNYKIDLNNVNYGLSHVPQRYHFEKPTVVLLHGTTWPTKHWPEIYWRQLAEILQQQGIHIKCLWGNETEKLRAEKICQGLSLAEVMPKLNLSEVASLLSAVNAVVAVDTGLGHLSAALATPTISLYGPSDPKRTGTLGQHQWHQKSSLPCSPCLQEKCRISDMKSETDPPCLGELNPQQVWQQLQVLLAKREAV